MSEPVVHIGCVANLYDETVAYCIHALRDRENNEILDPSMIPAGVSPLAMAQPLCT